MIKHLILDIGNVICNWDPEALVAMSFTEAADQKEALRVIVNHADWLALDRGDMSVDEAIWRAQARTHLNGKDVESVYDNLCKSLSALPGSMAAMARARDKGVRVYILSNMQAHAWQHLQQTFECFSWCAGAVVSCEARLIKPDRAIYQYVCDKFSILAEHCVFVDDMKVNTDAAIAFGMHAVQLTDKHAGESVINKLVDEIAGVRG